MLKSNIIKKSNIEFLYILDLNSSTIDKKKPIMYENTINLNCIFNEII